MQDQMARFLEMSEDQLAAYKAAQRAKKARYKKERKKPTKNK